MQGSPRRVRVLNRAVTVDYVWVKAGNGKFPFQLMGKAGKAVAFFPELTNSPLPLHCFFSLFVLFCPPSAISELHVELMSLQSDPLLDTGLLTAPS